MAVTWPASVTSSVSVLGLPGEHVGALIDEALILHEPGVPAAGMIFGIGHVDGAMAIWDRMRGVADVGVESGVVFAIYPVSVEHRTRVCRLRGNKGCGFALRAAARNRIAPTCRCRSGRASLLSAAACLCLSASRQTTALRCFGGNRALVSLPKGMSPSELPAPSPQPP